MYVHSSNCDSSNDRLTKRVLLWDKELNDTGTVTTWSSEIKCIFEEANFPLIYTTNCSFDKKFVVANMTSKFKNDQCTYLANACAEKPKLRTFNSFKNFHEVPSYILKPLSFHERRLVAKTRLGCLPIRLETGRYSIPRLPEDQRTCLVCNDESIESEIHYLFLCSAYSAERDEWFSKMTFQNDFKEMTTVNKLKLVLNDPTHIKMTAKFIVKAYFIRSKMLNKNPT